MQATLVKNANRRYLKIDLGRQAYKNVTISILHVKVFQEKVELDLFIPFRTVAIGQLLNLSIFYYKFDNWKTTAIQKCILTKVCWQMDFRFLENTFIKSLQFVHRAYSSGNNIWNFLVQAWFTPSKKEINV